MSQFDFPRISFHGKALLDTPTANNGYIPGVSIFNQNESEVFMPPRILFDPTACTPPAGATVYTDGNGNSYINPLGIDASNYQQWCTTPLGTFEADESYAPFYQCLQNYGMNPGYWNYYGDISMSLQSVVVTGITVLNDQNSPVTYTADNIEDCPPALAVLMGAELSFNNDYFSPGSRTSAYLCDTDSEGQLCTQIFYGQAGLYKVIEGENTTFFTGHPVKSTARFMNLFRVLNTSGIVPLGGSASFYTTVGYNNTSSTISQLFSSGTSDEPTGIFMKILMHEVHEIRNPDYNTMPVVDVATIKNGTVQVAKNPATVSITGSLTPAYANDMKTISVSRILKNAPAAAIAISTNGIAPAQPKGNNGPVKIPSQVNLAPIPFIVDPASNLISLDLSNMLHEYGVNAGALPPYAGNGDIPAFQQFISYNYGNFTLMFQPDSGGTPITIGNITYDVNYNMQQFVASAGMVDLPSVSGYDYSLGSFNLFMNGALVMAENSLYITTDQQGIYAEQSNTPTSLYMSDGLPRIPCALRVFQRGVPVNSSSPVTVPVQAVNFITSAITTASASIFDGMTYQFPVNSDGCTTYFFPANNNELFPSFTSPSFFPSFVYAAMNTSLIVCRVLSAEPQLEPYLSGQLPITWDVVFSNVLQLYKTIYPIMDVILPIEKATWSDPFIQGKILQLTNENNWNQPLFMPVTRDMPAPQRQLLQMWIQQSQSSQTPTDQYE